MHCSRPVYTHSPTQTAGEKVQNEQVSALTINSSHALFLPSFSLSSLSSLLSHFLSALLSLSFSLSLSLLLHLSLLLFLSLPPLSFAPFSLFLSLSLSSYITMVNTHQVVVVQRVSYTPCCLKLETEYKIDHSCCIHNQVGRGNFPTSKKERSV